MSTTATINWTNNSPSNTQEVYYGKDLLVTGLPGTGTGWIGSDQNPLTGSAGSLIISNLDDNVKYKFLVKTDCTNSQNIFSQSTGIKWVCAPLATSGPSSGILAYTLSVDPSVSNPGSPITKIVVTLIGTDRINQGVVYQTKKYGAPFSSSYTDQFNMVNGDVDWVVRVTYEQGTLPIVTVHECSSAPYSTISPPSTSYVQVRNALQQGTLSQLTIGPAAVVPTNLDAGNASRADVSAIVPNNPVSVTCSFADILPGTQLFARQIRAGAQIAGGLFGYIGANSPVSSVLWTIQNGDIIEIADAFEQGHVYRQRLVLKNSSVSNGYDVTLKIDIPQGAPTSYTVKFTGYDYSSGATENLSTVITMPQGQTTSSTTHVVSTLTATQYAGATISSVCVVPPSGITVPYYYSCPS